MSPLRAPIYANVSETHLFVSDSPPGRVLDKPRHTVRPRWSLGVVGIEEELWNGEVVRNVRTVAMK